MIVQAELLREIDPASWPAVSHQRGDFDTPPDIPAGHDIGVGAVIDGFMILVRADDATNMAQAVSLPTGTTGPKSGGFQQNFRTCIGHEGSVPGGLPVSPDCIGDIGSDVLFLQAAENGDRLAVRADDLPGGGLLAGNG